MKIEGKIYKGIAYVQLTDLPTAQQQKFLQHAGYDQFIKIMMDGKIVDQCIQYKDYSLWYENVYTPYKTAQITEVHTSTISLPVKTDLAFK